MNANPRLFHQKSTASPQYELYVCNLDSQNMRLEIWQIPGSSSPHLKKKHCIAKLSERNLALFEYRLLRRLHQEDIILADVKVGDHATFPLSESIALDLGLLFRILAPMRSRDNMRRCFESLEAMTSEERAYWLGMVMHRKNPQRILMALRILLNEEFDS